MVSSTHVTFESYRSSSIFLRHHYKLLRSSILLKMKYVVIEGMLMLVNAKSQIVSSNFIVREWSVTTFSNSTSAVS